MGAWHLKISIYFAFKIRIIIIRIIFMTIFLSNETITVQYAMFVGKISFKRFKYHGYF